MDYKVIRTEVEQAIAAVGEKYGFTATLGAITYSDIGFHTTLTAKNLDTGNGISGAELEYEMYSIKFDAPASSFGKYFNSNGEVFQIVGLNKKARTYPIIAKNVTTGATFKFNAEVTKHVRDSV